MFPSKSAILSGGAFKNNYSILFDGTNDYVAVASSSDFAFGTGDFTFSAWIYPTNITDSYDMILTFGDPSGMATPYFGIKTSKLEFYLSGVYSSDADYITINQWQHTVVTRTSGTVQLYLDGVALGSTSSQTTSVVQGVATIGAYVPSGTGHYFHGNIDEVAVFNVSLSATTIKGIYNGGIPADLAGYYGLIAYWRFQEGGGTSTRDLSGNGHTGTLTNSPTWSGSVPI